MTPGLSQSVASPRSDSPNHAQRVQVPYHAGLRAQRPYPLWLLGPDSLAMKYLDSLGSSFGHSLSLAKSMVARVESPPSPSELYTDVLLQNHQRDSCLFAQNHRHACIFGYLYTYTHTYIYSYVSTYAHKAMCAMCAFEHTRSSNLHACAHCVLNLLFKLHAQYVCLDTTCMHDGMLLKVYMHMCVGTYACMHVGMHA